MFLFSHLFGPFLGHTISLYMLYIEGGRTYRGGYFSLAVTAFWPFPLVLRLTGWYVPLALLSIQNLMFCVFWGCYQYGGVSSPILPWLVTVPLLAFFYLPERRTQNHRRRIDSRQPRGVLRHVQRVRVPGKSRIGPARRAGPDIDVLWQHIRLDWA